MAEKWPAAFQFLQNMNFTNAQIAEAAMMVDVEGMTPEPGGRRLDREEPGGLGSLGPQVLTG